MPRTPHLASALPLAVLMAGLSACSSGPRAAAAPAPEPVAEAPAPAPERIDEGFDIVPAEPVKVAPTLLGNASYDLPVEANRWVEMELGFLVNQRRDVVGRWLQRADRYDEWVRDVFAGYGIPRDLHHLAMVESGYQPTVRSRAGAVGMWQFMPATGRGMGLRIDSLVDERMDPVRSTHAAARHLKELNRDFGGDWALAAAAYNAGGGRISRGMNRFGARDFWELAERGDLAQETRHYVPRLYAVTIIAKDPERFGYPAPAGASSRRFAYDSVRVDLATPLTELAALGTFALSDLVDLNPHLVRQIAPANYWVWVPEGNGRAAQQAFDGSEFRRRGGFGWYTVRRGDDLASLALAAATPEDRIRQMNLGVSFSRLGPGDRLRLPADAARALNDRPRASTRLASADRREEEKPADAPAPPAPEQRADWSSGLVHSLPRETRRANARVESSTSASRTREVEGEASSRTPSRDAEGASSRTERSGGETAAPRSRRAGESEGIASRRTASRNGASDEESPSARSRRARPESRPAEARTHKVEEGETLWGIARRYDLTVAVVREANDLGEGETLRPGRELRIPRASGAPRSTERERSAERPRLRAAEHVVESGETLWSIARRYDSTVEAIRGANGLGEGEAIQPGQKLRIPRASGR